MIFDIFVILLHMFDNLLMGFFLMVLKWSILMVDSRKCDFGIFFGGFFVGLVCVVDYGVAIDFIRSELCK